MVAPSSAAPLENSTALIPAPTAWVLPAELDIGGDRGPFPLSIREVEVLDCVAQGLTNKEIATTLYLTEQTVKNHITSVLRKLDVNDRVQAVVHAVKHGWMELGPTTETVVGRR